MSATNYTFTPADGSLQINKVALTVTADAKSKVYGETNPALTIHYSGWQNTDGIADLTTAPTSCTLLDATSPVGVHANAITVAGGVDESYSFTYVAADFTVTKTMLTVTGALVTSKTYDGSTAATITGATLTGVVGTDDVTLSNSTAGIFASATIGTAIPVTTAMTLTGTKAGNYFLTLPSLTGTITSKPIVITPVSGQSKVYGQSDPAFTYTASPNLQGSDNFTGSLSRILGETVGSDAYAMGSLSAGGNYSLSLSPSSPKFAVTPKALAITANNGSKKYGAAYSFTGSEFVAAGLINGNTVTSVSLTSTGAASTAAKSGSPFPIVVSGAIGNGLENYTIVYAQGSLTVNPAVITFNTIYTNDKCFDGTTATTLKGFTDQQPVGMIAGDVLTLSGIAAFGTAGAGTGKPVSVTELTLGGAGAANYVLSSTTATSSATIHPKPVPTAGADRTIITGQITTLGTGVAGLAGLTGNSYAWSSAAGFTSSVPNPSVSPASDATYTILQTSEFGCLSDPAKVFVKVLPPTPEVTVSGASLQSSNSQGNQWYYSPTQNGEGSAITGATTQTYAPLMEGWYWTVVTQGNNSSEPSLRHYRIAADSPNIYNLYPVPNDGEFTLSIKTAGPQTFSVAIYNQLGQKIYELHDLVINGEFTRDINLRPASSGVYLIIIQSEKGKEVLKMNIVN